MAEETFQSSLLGKIAAYTEILEKDPRSTIFVSLGEAYRKLGHLNDARQIVENGLLIHPDFSPGHIVLARILCQQADYVASESSFSRALQLDDESLAGLVGYARLAVQIGDIDKARTLLHKARSLSPADPVINKFLNSLPPAAEEPKDEPVKPQEFSAPLISETLADLYLKQGLPDKALEILRELLSADPDNLELRRRIRDAEEMSEGQVDQAEVVDVQIETSEESSPALSADVDASPVEEPAQEPLAAPGLESELLSAAQDRDAVFSEEAVVASSPETAATPLEVLHQWLENIQKRRSNV